MTEERLRAAIADAVGQPVRELRRVAGGDINRAFEARLGDGARVFVKTSPDAPQGGFAAEAAGLRWLAQPEAIEVAEPLAVVDGPDDELRLLALRWIEAGRLDARGEEELGRGLAGVHVAGAQSFGGDGPLMLGALALPNTPAATWSEFYAEQRLRPLARMAADRGSLDASGLAVVDTLCGRLDVVGGPAEPPARLHGDLWAGNVMAGADGRPHLIDPLAYGGHREVDLAMLRLFGGPSARCFAAYEEVAPLADGHRERVGLHQVFPLLVHAVLFGGGYGPQAVAAASRYL